MKKLYVTALLTIIGSNNLLNAKNPAWQWAQRAGGVVNDYCNGITVDTSGNSYVAGSFTSPTITFGSTTLTNADNTGNTKDIFVVKYNASGSVLWAKRAGGTGDDISNSISVDLYSDLAITGSFNSPTITFGGTTVTNAGNNDIFIVKIQKNTGNWLWAKGAGGTGDDISSGIKQYSNGDVCLTGSFKSPIITFGSTTLTNVDNSGNTQDIFIVKYNSLLNLLWAKRAGGATQDYSTGISVDVNGNSFITGVFMSPTITFGSTTLTNSNTNGSSDIFLVKYDASGNVIWGKSAGGIASDDGTSVSVDASGNSFIAGCFYSSTVTFGSTTLTNIDNSGNTRDIFLAKYDNLGNEIWMKRAGGFSDDFASSIGVDANGNCYVTGYFSSPTIIFGSTLLTNVGIDDFFAVKYDALGNVLWAKSAGGTDSDKGNSISVDANGNNFITGVFMSPTITFGSTTLTNAFTMNMFAIKCDASGNILWTKSVAGATSDVGNSIIADAHGNSYVTGSFNSPKITFGSTILTNSDNTGNTSDIFIVKYDASSNVLWAKSVGGTENDVGECISTDASGNTILTGFFRSATITFGTITLTNYNSFGSQDLFLVKYDALGNVMWATKESAGASYIGGQSVCTDTIGNILLTGCFSGTTTFGGTTLTNVGNNDIFIVKYDANGIVLWAKSFGGVQNEKCYGISTDPLGNVMVTGYFGSPYITIGNITLTNLSTLVAEVFIAKFDASGNALWAKNAHFGTGTGISADANGNSYITGWFYNAYYSDSIIFDNITLYNANTIINSSSQDIFIVKYDPSGNVLWAKSAGGVSMESSSSIAVDANGNSVITGLFTSTNITFGSAILTNATGSSDIFVVKYDASGNALWAKGVEGEFEDISKSISIDANGNSYVTGCFNSPSVTFGNTALINTDNLNSIFNSTDIFIAKLIDDAVWPGDANHNYIVNNNDLLPIGLYYGQTGLPRSSISNVWQADSAANWGIAQTSGADIKQADCNGDGTINANDTLAINLNFNLTHAITAYNNYNNERLNAPDIYFITSGSSYNAGDWVDVEVWLGNSTVSVNNLYGISFNINYNSSLVQPGTESITYPVSWLGTIGTDAIKIAKVDPILNTAYGAITRIDQTNASGYGKIADFKFQLKTSIASASVMHFSISNYMADNAAGVLQVFNAINDSVSVIAGINEIIAVSRVTIFPNPFNHQTTIIFTEEQKHSTIKILDVLGKEVKAMNFSGKQLIIEKGEMNEGIYFVQIIDENKNVENRKIIIQ